MKRNLAILTSLLCLGLPAGAAAGEPRELIGALHEHSGYSDGWPGSRPADYYASARDGQDLHFLGSGEHETNLAVPFVASEECAENPAICLLADPVNPADSFRKWAAMAEQADAATDAAKDFTGFRGFEWSSDRQGHIDVYFSREYTQSTIDGSAVSVDTFYEWLARPASLGGGSDGLATFNHPGGKSLCGLLDVCGPEDDPAFNWDDFRYAPAVDQQMVGLEVFNGSRDFGSAPGNSAPPEGWYVRALDRGWHVGAVAAEDKGHDRTDVWGAPKWAKTVMLAPENSVAGIRTAMERRSFYAILDNSLRMSFTVDGAQMGSRLSRRSGAPLNVRAAVTGGAPVTLDLVTSRGAVVASGQDSLELTRPASAGEKWYYVRARRAGASVAYSSPVWIEPASGPPPPAGGSTSPGSGQAGGPPPGGNSRSQREGAPGGLLTSFTTRGVRTRRVLGRRAAVAFRAACSRPCALDATVRSTGRRPRRLGEVRATLTGPASRRIRVELDRGRLTAEFRSRRMNTLRLRVTVTDRAGRSQFAVRSITIKNRR